MNRFALGATLALMAAAMNLHAAVLPYTGVNLASAEFDPWSLPGTYGQNYEYPTNAEVDYYKSKGMNTIRLPFLWERLQPTGSQPFNTTELGRLNSLVNYATSQGMNVIIDPHNYARYYNSISTSANFSNLWARLAAEYKNNPRVMFGLMNEPNTMQTEAWLTLANSAIAAIRQAGATNTILVPGNAWTGAHSWLQNWYGAPNGTVMKGVVDPLNNFIFEVHQYFDSDSSGTHENEVVSPTIGVERVTAFTQWLKDNNYKAFLGEFGVPGSQVGLEAIDNLLDYMEANSDVWTGWSYWAGGPRWGDYAFSVEPSNGVDKPQMSILAEHATGAAIPEPGTVALIAMAIGFLATLGIRRRFHRVNQPVPVRILRRPLPAERR
jgi:endoglucanase